MADGNGVRRPIRLALRSSGHKAEIDQRSFGAIEIADEIGKDAGVETPAMNEDETHLATLHGARGAPRILFGKDIQESVDIRVLMRRGEGHSEPRRAGRNRRRPDGRSPQASTLEALAHGDRAQLVASLDEALLGVRPRPAGYFAALAS